MPDPPRYGCAQGDHHPAFEGFQPGCLTFGHDGVQGVLVAHRHVAAITDQQSLESPRLHAGQEMFDQVAAVFRNPFFGRTTLFQQRLTQFGLSAFLFLSELILERLIQLGADQLFAEPVLVLDRQGRAIGHGFIQPVGIDVIPGTEFAQGVAVCLRDRRTGKGDKLGVGQTGAHKRRQEPVLAPVGFIHHHVEIGLGGQYPEIHRFPALLHPLGRQRIAIVILFTEADVFINTDKELPFPSEAS